MKSYVYGLIDPRTMLIRYVGKGSRPDRPAQHRRCLKDGSRDKTHKATWIRELGRAGHDYFVCRLQECSSSDEALALEIWWIAFGRCLGWPLTNGTDGGDSGGGFKGRHHTLEARTRISESNESAQIGNVNRYTDISSQKFGLLTAMREHTVGFWVFQCELCGQEKIMNRNNIVARAKRGRTPSCGCRTPWNLNRGTNAS